MSVIEQIDTVLTRLATDAEILRKHAQGPASGAESQQVVGDDILKSLLRQQFEREAVLTNAQIISALGYVPANAAAPAIPDGSAAAPGMFFGLDTDTGFYRADDDVLNISAGGAEVASFGVNAVKTGAFYTDLSTGYMGLGRTDPNYWLDYNKPYTDFASGAGGAHHFHQYGYCEAVALTNLGFMTGFYSHLDGGASIGAGITVDAIYPIRGNLTWSVAGTLTSGRGVFGSAMISHDSSGAHLSGNGLMVNSYGGYFEAGNDTTGTGTTTNAHGVYAQVINTDGGLIPDAYGLYSYVRNQTDGGGITRGYGARFEMQSAGAGIANYYATYFGSSIPFASNFWNIYTSNAAKSWHQGPLAVGATSNGASIARLYLNEDAAAVATAVVRASHAAFTGDVLRVQADRAADTAYDFLTLEANGSIVARLRGDGGLCVGPSSSTAAYSILADKIMTGGTTTYGVGSRGTVQSGSTVAANSFHSNISTAAASFTVTNLRHYYAAQGTIGSGSTVTNQVGFGVDSTLIGGTNNYGFWGNIAAGTNRWNAYMPGTAANAFAGNTRFGGVTNPTEAVHVTGNIALSGFIGGAEQTAPSAPASDGYRIFAQDNGAGKTQLMVLFASGAAQQLAVQP